MFLLKLKKLLRLRIVFFCRAHRLDCHLVISRVLDDANQFVHRVNITSLQCAASHPYARIVWCRHTVTRAKQSVFSLDQIFRIRVDQTQTVKLSERRRKRSVNSR